jgi:type II secretory pathway component PulF
MALYAYQALNRDGKKVNGQLDAPSEQVVKDQLVKKGLYPVKIVESKEDKKGFSIRQLFEKSVTPKEKVLFTKQLATLLRSGVPLLQALELLADQFEGKMERIVIHLKDTIKEGSSLAQGLADYPRVFENIYIQLVRAGEASGHLEVVLDKLTHYLERRAELRSRVTAALREPLIQLVIVIIVSIFLLTFVVPKMAKSFKGKDLPLPTQIMVYVGDFIKAHFLFILIGLGILFIIFKYWQSTSTGRKVIDSIKLRLPIIGYFARMNAIVQFCSTLGILLESGVNLAEALDIVCNIVDNEVLATTLREARDKIIKEGKISQYLKQTKIFPPMATYLIRTGEESGQLDKMLITVAQNYESDLREYTDTLSSLLAPVMLLFMAVVVGFIVLSIMLPMVKMMDMSGM